MTNDGANESGPDPANSQRCRERPARGQAEPVRREAAACADQLVPEYVLDLTGYNGRFNSFKKSSPRAGQMAARKPSSRKIRLFKKVKQTSPVPAWVILKTKRGVRTNPKRRPWRTGDAEVG